MSTMTPQEHLATESIPEGWSRVKDGEPTKAGDRFWNWEEEKWHDPESENPWPKTVFEDSFCIRVAEHTPTKFVDASVIYVELIDNDMNNPVVPFGYRR